MPFIVPVKVTLVRRERFPLAPRGARVRATIAVFIIAGRAAEVTGPSTRSGRHDVMGIYVKSCGRRDWKEIRKARTLRDRWANSAPRYQVSMEVAVVVDTLR